MDWTGAARDLLVSVGGFVAGIGTAAAYAKAKGIEVTAVDWWPQRGLRWWARRTRARRAATTVR